MYYMKKKPNPNSLIIQPLRGWIKTSMLESMFLKLNILKKYKDSIT